MTQSEKRRHQATHSATSNALSAKTARACDSCLRARARCYCAADDAFLCQECDSVVHSANSLAGRHERVQLKTSSTCSASKACLGFDEMLDDGPAWHEGCKRRARTPRGGGGKDDQRRCRLRTGPLVPEIGTPSSSSECMAVDEEHLIHRVPIYDQVLSEFCTPAAGKDDVKPEVAGGSQPVRGTVCSEGLTGFHTHDMDLGEFEYDVENLLGHGLDGEHCMEGLGFNTMDSTEKGSGSGGELCPPTEDHIPVKEEEMYVDSATADIKFDCGSPWESGNMSDEDTVTEQEGKKKIMLKLDYESVIAAWSTQKSPWANGERPKLDCGDYFPDVMGMIWAVGACAGRNGAPQATASGGREARVSRYREKRRTRLFSKKIRYEVRKLNAEKRPRMKGRFVKRAASFAASTATKITSATATYAAPQYIF